MGIPYPEYAAQFSTWVELLGNLALIVGLVLPIICLLLIVDIAGAIYFPPRRRLLELRGRFRVSAGPHRRPAGHHFRAGQQVLRRAP